jgi:hypothetical protein
MPGPRAWRGRVPGAFGVRSLIELRNRSEAEVLGLLAAVETCLNANDIPSVRVELDDHSYVMEQKPY